MSQLVPRQVREQVSGMWNADRSLRLMLLFLIVTLFVIAPLSAHGRIAGQADLLAAAGFSLLGVSGVFAVTRTRGARIAGLLAMTAPIGLEWYSAIVPGVGISVLRASLGIIALVWLSVLTLTHVFRDGAITRARIEGAVAVYLLLAVVFAEAYWLVMQFSPDAFRFPHPAISHGVERSNLVYFSLTTLTTLGFGDILPVIPAARSLATMEGLVGQLYPAVLIGRLVSLQLASTQERA